ncbi:MAG: hypothetical protein COW08_04720 [Ignavibacteriales bacterium CG12_big_fil_rev_8_21_14_0_65_30_8]|nr:MAG: hypothetical protein COW08_04720 [Ignavibacteriales bacterium CG12_big_fil_rev_8_21_14_0_65_30_8]
MNSDTLNLLIVLLAVIIVVIIFVRIAITLRKYGGSLTTNLFGSTFEFLNKDKRKAAKEIVEMKANKKMEEEETEKPIED